MIKPNTIKEDRRFKPGSETSIGPAVGGAVRRKSKFYYLEKVEENRKFKND